MLGLCALGISILYLCVNALNNRLKIFINIILAVACIYGFNILTFEVLQVVFCGCVVAISNALEISHRRSKRGRRV